MRRSRRAGGAAGRVAVSLGLAALLLTACGGADSGTAPTAPSVITSTPGATMTPTPAPSAITPTPGAAMTPTPGTNPSVDPGLTGLVQRAVTDLAGRLGVGEGEISVVSAELVTWGDAGHGCPQKGRVYVQVVEDGSKIVLARGDTRYEYHTGGSATVPFLCTTPSG